MILSVSKFLEFSDDEILKAFEEEGIEVTAIHEPSENYKFALAQN